MIVPERKPRWLTLVLTYRGSALERIKLRLLSVLAVACAITVATERFGWPHVSLTTLPFTLIGFALGIFLGFRTNTSYDRFWEGRRLWGQLVNETRSFARQTLVLVAASPSSATPDIDRQAAALRHDLVRRTIGFVHALRMHLRDGADWDELARHFAKDEIDFLRTQRNAPLAILFASGQRLHAASRLGLIDPLHLPALDQSLSAMTDIQGGCERIKNTPIPHSYTVLIHGIVALYCFGLPFGLVDSLHAWTPVVVAIVAYAFLGLDAVGDEIEDPFGTDVNDLPLSALCRTIEVNLLQSINASDVPELATPDEFGVLS